MLNDIKLKIYNSLVNHDNGIRQAYHNLHDNAHGKTERIISYAKLLKMNMQFHLFGKRDFYVNGHTGVYEEKDLKYLSESAADKKVRPDVGEYLRKLEPFDVISFDIFDTLLIRPFSDPTDVFFFLGAKLEMPDFKRIRVEQEFLARRAHMEKYGNNEVSFEEIWERIERETGIPKDKGMHLELEYEKDFCFANPTMKDVFRQLKEKGKRIICISDMYLEPDYIESLLKDNGFTGIEKIYMSGEYKKSKAKGDIYKVVDNDLKGISWIHVGDNEVSDVEMAKKSGIDAALYPNIHKSGKPFRPFDMSSVIGAAYRGLVNDHIYGGMKRYTPEYEYGYIYGGIFALGYMSFVHDHCKKNGIDKILFLSRDGDILKKVYDKLYPDDETDYVFMSRGVSTRLMKSHDRYDFFRRFISYKVNRKLRISDVLKGMNLDNLIPILEKNIVNMSSVENRKSSGGLRSTAILTNENVDKLKTFLVDNWETVKKTYACEDDAARIYYSDKLKGTSKVGIVDIGWTGSGGLAISHLAKNIWGMTCEITGFVAGTNTPACAQPDAGEMFLQTGKIVPYIFSQSLNRDIMKKHDPNKGYNIFWELLLSSPTPQFVGFTLKSDNSDNSEARTKLTGKPCGDAGTSAQRAAHSNKNILLHFAPPDANVKGAKRIQKGIMDFVDDYTKAFRDYPFMFNISGRDAAAPLLLASSHKEKYLRGIARRFDFKIDVN